VNTCQEPAIPLSVRDATAYSPVFCHVACKQKTSNWVAPGSSQYSIICYYCTIRNCYSHEQLVANKKLTLAKATRRLFLNICTFLTAIRIIARLALEERKNRHPQSKQTRKNYQKTKTNFPSCAIVFPIINLQYRYHRGTRHRKKKKLTPSAIRKAT
jgi:hypothetical protein